MSDVPSWLNEENISTTAKVISNPAVQKAASNPAVQKAVSGRINAPPPPPPPTAPADDIEAAAPRASTASSGAYDPSEEFVIEEATLKSMKNYHLALRVLYMLAAAFLGVGAGLSLIGQQDLGLIFFALYVLFFALLICCFEFNLQMVARLISVNFGFLYTLAGRWIFMLFVGFMSFSFGTYGIAAMCFLYVVGLFHVYIMFKFPRFEEYLRKKHYHEGHKPSGK